MEVLNFMERGRKAGKGIGKKRMENFFHQELLALEFSLQRWTVAVEGRWNFPRRARSKGQRRKDRFTKKSLPLQS
jgi:hypothetical protein